MTKRRWTAQEDLDLKSLWQSKTVKELAEQFNRSVPSIQQRAPKLGLEANKVNKRKHSLDDPTWKCKKCNADKPIDEFPPSAWKNSTYICTDCNKAFWQTEKGLEIRSNELQRRKENPEKYSTEHRIYRLARCYKMTIEQYDTLFEEQGGVCKICGEAEKDKWLAVDHDHRCCPGAVTCGKCVRALLCSDCNKLIGKIENKRLETRISEYLSQ